MAAIENTTKEHQKEIAKKMATQFAEFIALEQLAKAHQRLPPAVDNDYPKARHKYEGALRTFIDALNDNGRIGFADRISYERLRKLEALEAAERMAGTL